MSLKVKDDFSILNSVDLVGDSKGIRSVNKILQHSRCNRDGRPSEI